MIQHPLPALGNTQKQVTASILQHVPDTTAHLNTTTCHAGHGTSRQHDRGSMDKPGPPQQAGVGPRVWPQGKDTHGAHGYLPSLSPCHVFSRACPVEATSEVEWGGRGTAWDGTRGLQGKAGHVAWPQAGGKDITEHLKDSQGQRLTGPHRDAGVSGGLVPTRMLDVALMGNWSSHWDAKLMGNQSLLGYWDAEPMGDWSLLGYWDAEPMGDWSLLGYRDAEPMGDWSLLGYRDAEPMGDWSLLGYRDAEPMGDWSPLGYRSQLALCVAASGAPTFPSSSRCSQHWGGRGGGTQLYLDFARRVLVHAVLAQ